MDWSYVVAAVSLGIIALTCLRDAAAGSSEVLTPAQRRLGVLVALLFLFDPRARVLYLPVPLLAGLALTSRWLLSATPSDQPLPPLAERRSRTELVAAAVGSKLLVPSANAPSVGLDHTLVLRLGPSSSAWQNGKLFARYSMALSVPWIVLYYLPIGLGEKVHDWDFFGLAFLSSLLDVAQWAVVGFLLGYFYQVIPGRNGLWKGFATAAAIIAPWLLYNLVIEAISNNGGWLELLVWSLQVFVTAVLTGFLAGELETLRRTGRGWNDLIKLHDFKALAAWGSSVVIAIGGALVTLLTSTLGQFVTSQLAGKPSPPGSP